MSFVPKLITTRTISKTWGELPWFPLPAGAFEWGVMGLRDRWLKQILLLDRAACTPSSPPDPCPALTALVTEMNHQSWWGWCWRLRRCMPASPPPVVADISPCCVSTHLSTRTGCTSCLRGQSSVVMLAAPWASALCPSWHPGTCLPRGQRWPGWGRSCPACRGSCPPWKPKWSGHYPATWPAPVAPWIADIMSWFKPRP